VERNDLILSRKEDLMMPPSAARIVEEMNMEDAARGTIGIEDAVVVSVEEAIEAVAEAGMIEGEVAIEDEEDIADVDATKVE
jgi:hypothetical protein